MKYLKYTQYIYLVAAIIFGIRAAEVWDQDQDRSYLFMGITALSVFMFFFRRKFSNKFEDRRPKPWFEICIFFSSLILLALYFWNWINHVFFGIIFNSRLLQCISPFFYTFRSFSILFDLSLFLVWCLDFWCLFQKKNSITG